MVKQKFKTLACDWLPPAIVRQIRRRRSVGICFGEEYALLGRMPRKIVLVTILRESWKKSLKLP
jgi:hypothetical protein